MINTLCYLNMEYLPGKPADVSLTFADQQNFYFNSSAGDCLVRNSNARDVVKETFLLLLLNLNDPTPSS